MTEPAAQPRPAASGSDGLRPILVATAIAGVLGYLMQAAVPRAVTDPNQVLDFLKFWSGLYLLVAALSGLQQEVTRATSPAAPGSESDSRSGSRSRTAFGGGLPLLALASGLGSAALVVATAPLWASRIFPDRTPDLVAALAVGLAAYAGVAVLSGVFYGLRLWNAVAGMTVLDIGLRLVLVGAALASGGDLAALAWAVVAPLPLSFIVLWLLNRGRVRGRFVVDVPPRRLAWNAARTLGGSIALGALTSGLVLLIGIAPTTEPVASVTALTFVVNLTRAPLVIPVLALQGWLIAYFRGQAGSPPGRVLRVVAAVLGASVLVAGLAFVVEPWLLGAIWGPAYVLDGPTCAGIVLTAGLMGALCVTGPATLAANRHSAYLAGWAVAAALTVGVLFTPLPLTPRVLLAMAAGPVAGVLIHLTALLRAAPVAASAS